jgi:hypothetical protein
MTGLALVAVLALGAGACTAKSPSTGAIGPVPSTGPGSSAAATGTPTPTNSPTPILPDGKSPVYLTSIDVAKRTITFDLIEFLTGDAAKKAWQKANPGAGEDGPPNDYFIVNDNPKLRTLPVADPVDFKVVDQTNPTGTANKSINFQDATAYFLSIKPDQSDHKLFWDPFWITVDHGVVTKIEEQFLP